MAGKNNTANGWIKIHRSLLNWEWWEDLNTSRVWITILLSVNHEPKKWKGMTVNEGELVTSYAALAKKCGLSVRSVRTSIEHLKSTNEVTCDSTSQHTVIKVVKWAEFQEYETSTGTPSDTQADKRPTSDRQTTDKRPTTNKNYKNEKNDKNEKNIRNIFMRPSLSEVTEYVNENHFLIDPEEFFDYYEANGWTIRGNTKMKDWKATVRNWNRRNLGKQKKQEDFPF